MDISLSNSKQHLLQDKPQTTRDVRLDSIKGVLIILVVLGHCIEVTSNGGIMRVLYYAIYAFHMPLFIFVSGYFTNLSKQRDKYFNSVLNLFLIFVIFQAIKLLPEIITSHYISLDNILVPQWTLWYLLSVVCWRIIFYVTNNLLSIKIDAKFILCCLLISIACGFVPLGGTLSIQRTLFYGVFFALGIYFREKQHIQKVYAMPMSLTIVFGLLSLCAILLFRNRDINWLLYGSSPYFSWPISIKYSPIVRIAQIGLASVMSCLIIKFSPVKPVLSTIGKSTLFIYIYHSFIIGLLMHIHWNCNDIIILIISLSVTAISLYILNKIKLLHYLIEPNNSIQNRVGGKQK